jgi:chromate transport protein ChrA
MKKNNFWISALASTLPIVLIIINLIEIFNSFGNSKSYTFGSEFHSTFSIYYSREIFIAYFSIAILLLCGMIFFAFKQKWKSYWILFMMSLVLFFYPIITTG